ncbi:alpha/beta hydrolase [Sphingomonas sp. MMSM20]|uniref:alpha/beta fold hydrolase n=1 Tax=Sphingomonas lycopersici TaxID=2951807 RepID=UPI00223870C7|nr:alpha/beta hydrolase [Sphingomonas lycopersici]MCW6532480.1 alpha/beta hydrolase [Sphingomonas lycopersici]
MDLSRRGMLALGPIAAGSSMVPLLAAPAGAQAPADAIADPYRVGLLPSQRHDAAPLGNDVSPQTRAWRARGKLASVFGNEIYYQRDGRGPTLVFIHGFPTSSYDWKSVQEDLRRSFDCVIFDLVGFGLSSKPEAWSYSLFQQADTIEGLMRALGIRSAHIVSHDMGTSVHTELLARKQAGTLTFDLSGSTFLNGSVIKGMATLNDFQKTLQDASSLQAGMKMVAELMPSYVDRLKQLMARPEVVTAEERRVMEDLLAHEQGNIRLPNVYSYVRERYIHEERWVGALRKENGPVQIIWGAADPIANIGMGRKLHELVPQAHYTELRNVGHFIPFEAPAEVSAGIRGFIGKIAERS